MGDTEPAPLSLPLPRTSRGRRTRQKILAAAEDVFGRDGYHHASIVDITRAAGVGQGTFYLYVPSKEALFIELVRAMGHEMRRRLHEATRDATDRDAAEEAGFRAFFEYVARHPNGYRVVRECEFVAPDEHRAWYQRLAERYVEGLRRASAAGQVRDLDLESAAYCLMGMGDFLSMRLVRWERRRRIPARALRTLMEIVRGGVLTRADPAT
jgi:AcrR family transcriptional regulator